MQEKARAFAGAMAESGIPFMFTCTYRSQEEQDALFAQGRTKPGRKVTWVRHSKHQDRLAFDIAILKDGKPTWDVKVDVSNDDLPDYEQAGEIGESLGLRWGGRFKTRDLPHFEFKGG
jgi:peptidoglycan L-alanyl-D-glutamate endopeptidase CwlK